MKIINNFSLDDMVADINRVWDVSTTPAELRDRLMQWHIDNRDQADELAATIAATLAMWIITARDIGHDMDVVEQVALQTFGMVTARMAKAMKTRQGLPFEPARTAIVTYALGRIETGSPPMDLDAMIEVVKRHMGATDVAT